MRPIHEIRADFDRESIVVYQAFRSEIACPAVEAQRFVAPFSFQRMTWIKPSFLWLMERSNWGQKSNQEHILAVRIRRAGWEEALGQAVLTTPSREVYRDAEQWRIALAATAVHVQWDPERSLRGATLPYRSIQVGLSRHIVRRYVDEWILEIKDVTATARKIYGALQSGHPERAKRLLPVEKPYKLPEEIRRLVVGK